jgi:hypothetical protein
MVHDDVVNAALALEMPEGMETLAFSSFVLHLFVVGTRSFSWHRGHDLLVLCSDAPRTKKCHFAALFMLIVGTPPSSPSQMPRIARLRTAL